MKTVTRESKASEKWILIGDKSDNPLKSLKHFSENYKERKNYYFQSFFYKT